MFLVVQPTRANVSMKVEMKEHQDSKYTWILQFLLKYFMSLLVIQFIVTVNAFSRHREIFPLLLPSHIHGLWLEYYLSK